MKHFFTYGDDRFRGSKERIYSQAVDSGFFDVVKVHGPEDISDSFKKRFQEILSRKRGGGYWIWKLFFLDKYLKEIETGDFLIYLDAGCTINKHGRKRFEEYLEMLQNSKYGFISFATDFKERQWTFKELYEHFGLTVDDTGANSSLHASLIVAQKCDHSLKVMREVMRVLRKDPCLITDDYNDRQNDFFIDARHDQSFLSLARKKYGSLVLQDEVDINLHFPFLQKILTSLVTQMNDKNPKRISSPTRKRSKFLQILIQILKPHAHIIRLIWFRIFQRHYPFWATRIRL